MKKKKKVKPGFCDILQKPIYTIEDTNKCFTKMVSQNHEMAEIFRNHQAAHSQRLGCVEFLNSYKDKS